jgi:indole-3-glycerol phosphate synthase
LDDDRLARFHELAVEAGLAALVEVHDQAEMDRALDCGAKLIGVNNRDLRTFHVDLAVTELLAARLAEWSVTEDGDTCHFVRGRNRNAPLLVGESGIHVRSDVERLRRAGVRAILVGESLMKAGDIGAKAAELLGL